VKQRVERLRLPRLKTVSRAKTETPQNLIWRFNNMSDMSYIQFLDIVNKKIQGFILEANLAHRTALIDSTLATINPGIEDGDYHFDVQISLLCKTKAEILRLTILSYWLPKTHGYLLRLEIDALIGNNSDFFEIRFLLKGKEHLLIWLRHKTLSKGRNYVINNLLDEKLWTEYLLNSLYKVKKVRNHKRNSDFVPEKRVLGVGYKDKGSRPKDARGGLKNFMLTLLQNEIEETRACSETLNLFFEGFMT